MLYNSTAKRGIVYNKLVYIKYGAKRNVIVEAAENIGHCDEEPLSYTEELDYMLFFRTCVVQREKDVLKLKLRKSIAMREKIIRTRNTDFPEKFPFYFISPDLVGYNDC